MMDRSGKRAGAVSISSSALAGNVAVIGPPGSGKTESIIVPWIESALADGYSVVCFDAKGGLLNSISPKVRNYVPSRELDLSNPAESTSWTSLQGMDSERSIDDLVDSIIGERPARGDVFFHQQDTQILREALTLLQYHQTPEPVSITFLIRLFTDQEFLVRTLAQKEISDRTYGSLQILAHSTRRDYERMTLGVRTQVEYLNRPGVQVAPTDSDFSLSRVLGEQMLVSIVARIADHERNRIFASMFLKQLVTHAIRQGQHRDNSLAQKILIVVDEAGFTFEPSALARLIEISRSLGFAFLISMQNVVQVETERDFLANIGTVIMFSGVSMNSAEYLSNRLGMVREESSRVGGQGQAHGRPMSRAQPNRERPLLAAVDIANIPFGRRPAVVQSRVFGALPMLVDIER